MLYSFRGKIGKRFSFPHNIFQEGYQILLKKLCGVEGDNVKSI